MIRVTALLLVSGVVCFAADSAAGAIDPWLAAGVYSANYTTSKGSNEFHDLLNFAPDDNMGLNNIFLGVRASSAGLFGAVTLQYGDIPRSGWDPDIPWLQEAWVGYHVDESLDLTAGAFTSTIGIESLLSYENYSGIVSVPGFFNPGFYSGVQLQWNASNTLSLNTGILSSFSDFTMSGSVPALSLGITHSLGSNKRLSVQTMLSEEQADAGDQYQLFVSMTGSWNEGTIHVFSELNGGHEFANQMYPSSSFASGLIGAYYDLSAQFQTGLRVEGIYDPQGALVDSRFTKPLPYNTMSMVGVTATMTYRPSQWSLIRADARYLGVLDSMSFIEVDPGARERTEFVLSADVFFLDLNQ